MEDTLRVVYVLLVQVLSQMTVLILVLMEDTLRGTSRLSVQNILTSTS